MLPEWCVGGPPIPVLEDEKPIGQFLTLEEMEVTLLVTDETGTRCTGFGIIDECSPKGVWCGYLVPHSFFVIVNLTSVNSEYRGHTAYCEEPSVSTLGDAENHRVLWSGYKARPTEPLGPPIGHVVEGGDIGGPPTAMPHLVPNKLKDETCSPTVMEEGLANRLDAIGEGCQGDGREGIANMSYPDRPLWRGKQCDLLNEDLSFFGKARIVVCLSDEPFDEDNLEDTHVGIMFLLEGDMQMTSFRWPLTQVRLEGGRLLSEIVTWCSEHAGSSGEDSGLEGVPKNSYRHIKRRKCCQTFNWDDTLALRRKFHSSTIEARREIAYAVQGQLHSLPGRRKKFITFSNREVCENAWYIIHGISRAAYHAYKTVAIGGWVTGTHGNTGIARPRPHTIQAEANIMTIINDNADCMPNEFRNIGKKRVNNLLVLPSSLNWNHVRDMSNLQSAQCFVKPVSQSKVNVMKNKDFKNVEVKAPSSNFSRCTECDFLQDCILRYPRGSEEWATLVKDRTRHINYQNACRRLYHGWSSSSVESPTEFLCFIHDKMDHMKSAIPRMLRNTKATSGLGQIPISVTGMLTHGYGDGSYAHYSSAFWPSDSNFTISSISRDLRAQERPPPPPPVKDSKELFTTPPQNSFFEALLYRKSRCTTSIPTGSGNRVHRPPPGRPAVPLPKKLFLQLDNSAKDNKNRYVMAFCSLLTAKKIFQEVTVGFLIVGHTHEDIDAHFSYLSQLLKTKNIYVLADLMKAFMDSQKTTAFIPELVQEVADFKKFLVGYQHDGANRLIGLGDMHLFKFYVEEEGEDKGWPVMRYKKRATDQSWLPPGPAVKMWRANDDGTPKLPTGVPLRPLWANVAVDPAKKKQEAHAGRRMYDKTEFYPAGHSEVYRALEVNDGKGCTVCQRNVELRFLLGVHLLGDHRGTTLVVHPRTLGLKLLLTQFPRTIPSLTRTVDSQGSGRSLASVPIEMFSLETLCSVGLLTDIASQCGWDAPCRLLI
uniref:DUF7869 domain-containing protein n=1 Tax=Physcomitrium patens TaxID=3218 RepID=A0A2K1KXP1_PHYPA|nr:hypothetical protein PHYPA_005552 [Physcomitrium patens]